MEDLSSREGDQYSGDLPVVEQEEQEGRQDSPPPPVNAVSLEEAFQKFNLMGSHAINSKLVRGVMRGPRCWKCYDWGTFFECENCGKHFHRECAFMSPGFPNPIFDKSVEEAGKVEFEEVKMVKCPLCIVAEETRVDVFRNIPQCELNKFFVLFGKHIILERAGNLLKDVEDPDAITASKIVEKATRNEYKTVEGFYADYKMIIFNTIVKYSIEDEATIVAKMVLANVCNDLSMIINTCWECGLKQFQTNGRLCNQHDFLSVCRLPCEVPHAVLWIKDPTYPFWPSKVLNVEGNQVYFQSFGEKAGIRAQKLLGDDGCVFKTFSVNYPNQKKILGVDKKLSAALSNCKKYLDNLREKFGEAGVVVPDESKAFDGDLSALMKEMFPLYDGKQDDQVKN